MSSIMRARSALTGRGKGAGVIGVPLELKVAGPSMLGIGCPDRHPLPLIHSPTLRKCTGPDAALPRERVRSMPLFGYRHQRRRLEKVENCLGLREKLTPAVVPVNR